jgi:hypothetical protein
MKRNLLILAIGSFALLVSCKTNKNCVCTYNQNGVKFTENIILNNVSNKTAQEDCTNQPLTIADSSGSATVSLSCQLE